MDNPIRRGEMLARYVGCCFCCIYIRERTQSHHYMCQVRVLLVLLHSHMCGVYCALVDCFMWILLYRLSCQLVPETGILFLVLPSRCINSKHVGGINMMTSLLAGLGLRHVLPVRQTPKLIFFILGNSTEKKKKHTPEGTDASATIQDTNIDIQTSNQGSATVQRTQIETDSTRASAFNWRIHVRTQLATTLKAGTLKHFTQDFSDVPPNEFAIQLSDDLVSLCS